MLFEGGLAFSSFVVDALTISACIGWSGLVRPMRSHTSDLVYLASSFV